MARRKQGEIPLEFSCACGQLQGQIADEAIAFGTHLVCYCRDCRATQLYFNQPDPAPGPVDLWQTTPDAFDIQKGADKLGLFRLGPRGAMRWFATCCNTPMFNTATTPKVPFAVIQVDRITSPDRLGPVVGKAFVPKSSGKTAHQGLGRIILKTLPRIAGALLSGRWRKTPFFDVDTGKPVADPVIPGKQERAALYH